jgi:hypothetical protein
MQKLGKLSDKELAGAQPLDGTYRVTLDIEMSPDATYSSLQDAIRTIGKVENISIEKYNFVEANLRAGEVVELTTSFECDKPIYMDSHQNLVISDKLATDSVEDIGTFALSLPAGTVAEVNKAASGDNVEVLFTGAQIEIPSLGKTAYLGILNLPLTCIRRYQA